MHNVIIRINTAILQPGIFHTIISFQINHAPAQCAITRVFAGFSQGLQPNKDSLFVLKSSASASKTVPEKMPKMPPLVTRIVPVDPFSAGIK